MPKHGESMDTFRAAVRVALNGEAPVMPEPKPEPAPDPTPEPEEPPMVDDYILYTVQPRDTLWAIARDRLGSGSRYKEIIILNGLSSDKIRTGQVLRLPE